MCICKSSHKEQLVSSACEIPVRKIFKSQPAQYAQGSVALCFAVSLSLYPSDS